MTLELAIPFNHHEAMNTLLASSNAELAIGAILFGFVTAIFWMVVGWRAMRAHERRADAAEYSARVYGNKNKPQ